MGIVILVNIKNATYQPLAVIAPALLRRASPSRHCIPNIYTILYKAQRRIHIRITRLRHLRSLRRCALPRRKVCRMAISITTIFVQHQLADESRMLIHPLHFIDRCIRFPPVDRIPREPPLYLVHVPPLRHEEKYGPCDDPEECEVEDPADPACTPAVDESGRVDVDGFLVDAEGDVGVPAVVRRADDVLEMAAEEIFLDAFYKAIDAEGFGLGRRGAEVLAPIFQRTRWLVGKDHAGLVAGGFGLSPAPAVCRLTVFHCTLLPECLIVRPTEVLLETECDVEIRHPFLLFLVLAANRLVVPAEDSYNGPWWHCAHVVCNVRVELGRVVQALVHADGDRARVGGLAIGALGAERVCDDIVGFRLGCLGGSGGDVLRYGGRAGSGFAIVVGRKVIG